MTLFKNWKNPLDRRFKRGTQPLYADCRDLCWNSTGQPRPDRICRSFENGYVLSKGDKELEKAITHFLLELKPWNEALVYSIEKNSRIHRSTLDREMGRMDERTSWIKNYKYPIFSKSAQVVGRIRWSFLLD